MKGNRKVTGLQLLLELSKGGIIYSGSWRLSRPGLHFPVLSNGSLSLKRKDLGLALYLKCKEWNMARAQKAKCSAAEALPRRAVQA